MCMHSPTSQGMSQGEEVQMPHSGQSLESILQQYTMWLTACENTYQKSEIRELELKNQAARLRERLETCSAIILDVADPLQKDVEEDVLDCSERAQCADRCMVCPTFGQVKGKWVHPSSPCGLRRTFWKPSINWWLDSMRNLMPRGRKWRKH